MGQAVEGGTVQITLLGTPTNAESLAATTEPGCQRPILKQGTKQAYHNDAASEAKTGGGG